MNSEAPTNKTLSTTKRISPLAIPLLGFVGAVQGADPNIASTALFDASRSLDMTGGLLAVAASVSTLALAATVVSTGLLADRMGRRRVLMAALVLAAIGDLLVVIAPSSSVYLVGRILAGIGLGAVFGAAFAYIRAVTPPAKIPYAVGIFSAVGSVTLLIMTFLGGTLASIDWRLAFLLVPVASILGAFLVPILLPKQEPVASGKQDVVGQVLLALGVVAFLYGVSHLGSSLTGVLTLGPIIAGILLLAGFFVYESRVKAGFFPVSLFRNPVFLAAVAAGFVFNFANAVAFLQLANLWQYINRLTTLQVSLWQLPILLTAITTALIVGKRMSKGLTNRTALLMGTVATAAGLTALSIGHSSTSFLGFIPGTVLVGAGITMAALAFGNLILKEAPAKYLGPVTSSRTTIGQFFYAMGLALGTVLVDRLTTGGVIDRLNEAGVPPTRDGAALDAVTAFAQGKSNQTGKLAHESLVDAAQSYGEAFAVTTLATAVIVLIVGLIGVVLLHRHEGPQHPPSAPLPGDGDDDEQATPVAANR